MDRDAAVARIKRGLGFRSDQTDNCIAALQEAQRALEIGRSLPVFLLQEDQTMVAPSGSAEVALPDGFIREEQGETFFFVGSDGEPVFLEKIDFNAGKSRFLGADAGKPQAYTLRKATFAFWPSRDVSYTLTWSYFKRSVSLATNVSDNEWLQEDTGAPEALIGAAGMIVAADLNDQKSLAKFQQMYSIYWNNITANDLLREEENQPSAMGARL